MNNNLHYLIRFKARLPEELLVKIKKSQDGGYFAEVVNLPGCHTQAETVLELLEMINYAVFTYFDIPQKYIPDLPTYLPEKYLIRKQIEENKIPPQIFKNKIPLVQV